MPKPQRELFVDRPEPPASVEGRMIARTCAEDTQYQFDCLDIDVEFLARGLVTPRLQEQAQQMLKWKAEFSRNNSETAYGLYLELLSYGLDVK